MHKKRPHTVRKPQETCTGPVVRPRKSPVGERAHDGVRHTWTVRNEAPRCCTQLVQCFKVCEFLVRFVFRVLVSAHKTRKAGTNLPPSYTVVKMSHFLLVCDPEEKKRTYNLTVYIQLTCCSAPVSLHPTSECIPRALSSAESAPITRTLRGNSSTQHHLHSPQRPLCPFATHTHHHASLASQ